MSDEKRTPEPTPTPRPSEKSDFQRGAEAIKRESEGGNRNENADRQLRDLEPAGNPHETKD